MVKLGAFATILSLCVLTVASKLQADEGQVAIPLDTLERKMSYLIGYSTSKQIQDAGMSLDEASLLRAMEDVGAGSDLLLNEEEMQGAISIFQNLQREFANVNARKKNIDLGERYLTENAKRNEITQTASGLQYEKLQNGDGASPTLSDSVSVHYHGTLLDGSVFDSSVERDEPAVFPLQQVIPGWTEVLQLMQVGDKWRVSIPYNLAYPDGTINIEPGSTLIFNIELLRVIAK